MYMLFNGNAIRIGWRDFIVSFKMFHGEGIVGRGVYRSYYKGHKDKIKGCLLYTSDAADDQSRV